MTPDEINAELEDVLRGVIGLVERGLLVREIKDDGDGVKFHQQGFEIARRIKAARLVLETIDRQREAIR